MPRNAGDRGANRPGLSATSGVTLTLRQHRAPLIGRASRCRNIVTAIGVKNMFPLSQFVIACYGSFPTLIKSLINFKDLGNHP